MSRTYHHSWRYRLELDRRCKLPWWKLWTGPPRWMKRLWAGEVRTTHKQEMLRHSEDPVLTHPRRIVDPWDWL